MATPVLPWTSATVTPRKITENETVSGQLTGLLAENSPYIQASRSNAADASRSRGMLNSSLGIGAGEKAAIEAAAPIAGQDASTYAAAGLSAQNANQEMQQQKEQSQQTAEREKLAAGYTMEQNKFLANEDYKKLMANLEAADRQSFASATLPLMQQYQSAINAAQMDPNMSTEGKAIAMNNLKGIYMPQITAIANIYGYKTTWKVPSYKTSTT